MTRRSFIVFALVCALAAGPAAGIAAAAASDSAAAAIADCSANDRLTHQYSSATLTAALAKLPADVREYSDCYDVIEKQLFAQLGKSSGGGSGGGSSSGGSVLPTWLLIVIVVLALAALTFGALAIRSRRCAAGDGWRHPVPVVRAARAARTVRAAHRFKTPPAVADQPTPARPAESRLKWHEPMPGPVGRNVNGGRLRVGLARPSGRDRGAVRGGPGRCPGCGCAHDAAIGARQPLPADLCTIIAYAARPAR